MSPREHPPRDDQARHELAKEEVEAAESKAAEGRERAQEKAESRHEPATPAKEAAEAASEEAAAEAEGAEAEGAEEEEAKPRRRRRAAETSTRERKRDPREREGAINVSARARYVRTAPRKARLVMEHIRGKDVDEARAILAYAPRAAAGDVLEVLESAVANAEANHELGPDELRVRRAYVDEGPTIKRYRPRALGRATRINKRTSHMTIELTTEGK